MRTRFLWIMWLAGLASMAAACGADATTPSTAAAATESSVAATPPTSGSGNATVTTTVPAEDFRVRLRDPGGLLEYADVDAALVRVRGAGIDIALGEGRDPSVRLFVDEIAGTTQLTVPDGVVSSWHLGPDELWYPGPLSDAGLGPPPAFILDRALSTLAGEILPLFGEGDVVGAAEHLGINSLLLEVPAERLPPIQGITSGEGVVSAVVAAEAPHTLFVLDSGTFRWEVAELGGDYTISEPPEEDRTPGWAFEVGIRLVGDTGADLTALTARYQSFDFPFDEVQDVVPPDVVIVSEVVDATDGKVAVLIMDEGVVVAAQDLQGRWLCSSGYDLMGGPGGAFRAGFGYGSTPDEVDTVDECRVYKTVGALRDELGFSPPPQP